MYGGKFNLCWCLVEKQNVCYKLINTIQIRILIKFTYFQKKKHCFKDLFFIYVCSWSAIARETNHICVQIQRDQKKIWCIKIFVIWIAYPWEYNIIEYQYIKLLVHSILFPTHLVLILTKKPTQTEIISWYLNSLQLASAMENLKHIFTAPEIVRKTEELISEGKLLQAHKQYVR